jgi:hypothetical protein
MGVSGQRQAQAALRLGNTRYPLYFLIFYIRLIPTLFLTLVWLYQPERVQDGFISRFILH